MYCPLCAAVILSGNALAITPQTTSSTRFNVIPLTATGAGKVLLTIDPFGNLIVIGLKLPSLFGTLSPVKVLTA